MICDLAGSIVSWRLTPMHCHEAVMAKRMMRDMELNGYVLADSNYDSVKLYELCVQGRTTGGSAEGLPRGSRRAAVRNASDRRRAIDMLEQSMTGFGRGLLSLRARDRACVCTPGNDPPCGAYPAARARHRAGPSMDPSHHHP
ncbi:MAG: hypothetical protein KF705_08625 [Phycisphaeraceae bacterium]|nr:hypothetical protein [Phycisphaeraceae bacterium]